MQTEKCRLGTRISAASIASVALVALAALAAFAVVVWVGIIFTSPASADVPRMINYQGVITDKDTGKPLAGEHSIVFTIFNVPFGGSALWSEEQQVVADSSGVVNVLVGSEEKIGIAFDGERWLEVAVDGEVLAPRRHLVSVPYAFQALASGTASNSDSLGGQAPAAFAASVHTHDDRYYTETELHTAGTVNNAANPVDWTKLKNVPAGFADGTDNVGPGDGYSLDASDGNPTDALYVNASGNVGIGTQTPTSARLQVDGSSSTAIRAESDSAKTAVFAVVGSAMGSEGNAAIVATSTTGSAILAYSSANVAIGAGSSKSTVPAISAHHSNGGPAIYGTCSNDNPYPAIEAFRTDQGPGVASYVGSGVGVYAFSGTDGSPVVGVQSGYSRSDLEGYSPAGGSFCGANGVIGLTKMAVGYGVLGISQNASAYAGAFYSPVGNGVGISTPGGKIGLSVAGGSKSAVVATADGARSLYCEEASEVWFTDYGFGELDGGVAVVAIDPIFAQTVNLTQPYHVFVQAYGDADLYVASRTADHFEVRLSQSDPAGDSSAEFSYRLVAKRAGFEKNRLDRAAWADNDANLFPGKPAPHQGGE
jgi:hypothetical protein